jgi:hypothetical protein
VALELARTNPSAAADFASNPPTVQAKQMLVDGVLQKMARTIANLTAGADPDFRPMLDDPRQRQATIRLAIDQADRLRHQLDDLRAGHRADLHDKAIFFGGVASSLIDSDPTALFRQCPGVVIQGAIYNGILTGKIPWRTSANAGT